MNISRKFEERKLFWCVSLGILCVAARFVVGAFSLNYFDFKSWCIVGEIINSGRNVYAETARYNYGPTIFIILGWLHKIACIFPHSVLVFKFLIVSVLTLADFFLARLAAKKAGALWGLVFFLNPISFITCSYLSQFDGMAVAFAAYGVSLIEDSSRRDEFTVNDLLGTLLLSLSLITKHIMWAFPLWLLLDTKITPRKKALYAFVPPLLFLLSFVPYWSLDSQGIINNVFLYRARNNLPMFALDILNPLGIFLPFQRQICFIIFGLLMLSGGYIFRREEVSNNFLLYTISVVCFSSAISTQYLSIPCMALVVLFREKALPYFPLIAAIILGKHIMKIVMVWALLLYLIDYYRHQASR